MEILEIAGKSAGLGGLVVGVFLLLFRDVIQKNIFSSLTKEQSYKTVKLFLFLVWSVAIFGMVVWLVSIVINRPPVNDESPQSVVIMDSPLRDVVFDLTEWESGRTNADTITEILDDIPNVILNKETTSLIWEREDQVLKIAPTLIIIHASCFYDKTSIEDADRKFYSFLKYMSSGSIKFIIYSRGFHHGSDAWRKKLLEGIPSLVGRIDVIELSLDGTFSDASVRRELKSLVKKSLKL